jgi:hypothetical protein
VTVILNAIAVTILKRQMDMRVYRQTLKSLLKKWVIFSKINSIPEIDLVIVQETSFSGVPSGFTRKSTDFKMSEFESVLKQLGSFGPYQRRIFVLVSMFETPAAWAMLLPIFLNVVPKQNCHSPLDTNATETYKSSQDINSTTLLCTGSGDLRSGVVFCDDVQSIVSEVRELFFGQYMLCSRGVGKYRSWYGCTKVS